MTVSVRAKLPKGDTNGLAHLEAAMAANPDGLLVIVGYLRPDTIEQRPHDDDNPRVVKTVLVHIEVVADADADKAATMLRDVYGERTGKVSLPFEDDET